MLTLSVVSNSYDTMDCSPPGSSVHRISQGREIPSPRIFPTQGSNLSLGLSKPESPANAELQHWQADSLPAEPSGKPIGGFLMLLKFSSTTLVRKLSIQSKH